jgi:hypothetical protein
LESNLFFCVKFQGTTKKAFVANAIQFALEHHQLFTHYHATKVIEVAAKYAPIWTLILVHPRRKNNYRYNFSAHMHHFCIDPL